MYACPSVCFPRPPQDERMKYAKKRSEGFKAADDSSAFKVSKLSKHRIRTHKFMKDASKHTSDAFLTSSFSIKAALFYKPYQGVDITNSQSSS